LAAKLCKGKEFSRRRVGDGGSLNLEPTELQQTTPEQSKAMSGTPSKDVKVPAAAANYTPGTIDEGLRSGINHALLEGGYAAKSVKYHKLSPHMPFPLP